eukprot:12400508-Karenia_brevis.AAC.1
MGPDPGHVKDIGILNRILRYGVEGIEYEADPKHRDIILDYLGFDAGARSFASNGDKQDRVEEDWESWGLNGEESTECRGVRAR